MALKTTTSAKAWAPDIQAFLPSEVIPDALIFQGATVVTQELDGDGPLARIPWVDDASASFVAEGASIDESEPDLAEVLVATGKIAQLIPVSNEQFFQDSTAQRLSDSVRRAIMVKANQAFLSQVAPPTDTVTPPEGIITQAEVTATNSITKDLDPLAEVIGQLENNGAIPNLIVANPLAWSALRTLKASTDSNTSLLGAGTEDQGKRLLGVPVITSPAVPDGKLVIIDSTAIAAAVGPVNIARSEHVYFSSDRIALRATWRIGWKVARKDRLATITVEPA